MPVLNDADELKLGTLAVSAAYLGSALVWELEAAPELLVAPAVTGGTSIGSLLTCSTGTWTGSPTSYAYQWQEYVGGSWTNISGATSSTLDTTGFDPEDVRCQVVATNAYGDSDPAVSNTVTLTDGVPRIFGNNVLTGGGGPNSENRLWAVKYNKAYSGAVTSANANFANADGTGNFAKFVVMADNAGVPGTVLWVTSAAAIPSGGGNVSFALPGDVSATNAAGDYWLAIVAFDHQGQLSFGSASGFTTVMVNGGFSYASPPGTCPAPDATYDDQAAALWCDYIG